MVKSFEPHSEERKPRIHSLSSLNISMCTDNVGPAQSIVNRVDLNQLHFHSIYVKQLYFNRIKLATKALRSKVDADTEFPKIVYLSDC